jgi:hypothetical protein
LSIDWWDKIINVPKTYMTLIQSTPSEIRELNIDSFRLDLRALEASEEGVVFDYTHNHVAPVSVGGVTLARVVEIVNDYTVTFEDGQYAVNIVGGNSNIGDRVNVNQVSVRSANSAGLITNAAIEFSSFNSGVTIDVNSGFAGTTFPVGTLQSPVNNLADALLIAEVRGFDKLYIIDDFVFEATDNIDGFQIVGQSTSFSHVTVTSGCSTDGTEFYDCTLGGDFSGTIEAKECFLTEMNGVRGNFYECSLGGNITLSGSSSDLVQFIKCYLGTTTVGVIDIDMNGDGPALAMRGYTGGVRIINKTGSSKVTIDFDSGRIELDSTITAGTFFIRGIGEITLNDATDITLYDTALVNPSVIWDVPIADHLTDGTTGKKLYDGGTGDTDAIAAAVWDTVIYPDHLTNDTAGKYIYEFYHLIQEGDVYVSTSTSSEILMVRDRLGDAGVLITETVVDEEAISTDANTVFPSERLLYAVNGVWLASDTGHQTDYYTGANGEFDSYTGKITLHTSLTNDNESVLINYTFMRGLPDNVIDQFLVEAKLYVKKYTRKDYDWSLGLGASPDEETQIALLAACSLAAMRCLEAIATGDILQFGYNFRLGDLQVESMTSGGFHVQAHIDFLKGDVERKLAMLGRAMYFVARTTRSLGRDAWGYKRQSGGGYKVY